MDDMNAFERQVAAEVVGSVRPPMSVDAMAIVRAATTDSPAWRYQSMFSATKLVVAGAIVALFGGSLLAGVLTQPSEEQERAVGAAASPSAEPLPSEESLSPVTSRTDLVPGVELVVEEVEPGVFRVVGDGMRDLSIRADRLDLEDSDFGALSVNLAVAADGSVDLFWPDESFRVGEERTYRWGYLGPPSWKDEFDVLPDGTVLLRRDEGTYVRGPGREWPGHPSDKAPVVTVDRDGTTRGARPARRQSCRVPRLSGPCQTEIVTWDDPPTSDGTLAGNATVVTRVPPAPNRGEYRGVSQMWLTAAGDVWLIEWWEQNGDRERVLVHVDEDKVQRYPAGPNKPGNPHMAPDGTLWAAANRDLQRFDGSTWERLSSAEGDVPSAGFHPLSLYTPLAAGMDGSVWYSKGDCGLANFDGETSRALLEGHCVVAIAVGPDGAVWVLASRGRYVVGGMDRDLNDIEFPWIETYVVSPSSSLRRE